MTATRPHSSDGEIVTLGSVTPGYDFERDDSIVIGLVNNMPDAALRATERQFCELLAAASQDRAVRLRFFSLPGIPRTHETQPYLRGQYEEIGQLWGSRIDGLIVTGTEPRAPELSEEPYWPVFAKLVDWAEEHTVSTVWSCLAAHAAVLQSDGIARRRLREKLFGLFECNKVSDHALLKDVSTRWRVPHSRYNDLPEYALVECGYHILSCSADAGADMFLKQRESLFVFLQGHPEYDGHTLLREYRRDVQRFLASERDSYPELPRGYFDNNTLGTLAGFRAGALHKRDPELMRDFPIVQTETQSSWKQLATRFYTNWLSYLAEHRYSDRVFRLG